MAGSFSSLHVHYVFSTKERRPILTHDLRALLIPYVGGIAHNLRCEIIEAGGIDDHLHLLARLHQDVAVSEFIRTVKSNASKWLREEHHPNWLGWQDGYGAFTVSRSHVDDLRRYVRTQSEHHARRSFQNEFLELLRRHNIDFDQRYIWQ